MLDVTWEWISTYEPALDVANTIALEKGVEHDLLAPEGEYARWAEAAARSPELPRDDAAAIGRAQPLVLELREHIRAVFRATAAGEALPGGGRRRPERGKSRRAGVDGDQRRRRSRARTQGGAVDRLLADYARSAMAVAADGTAELRVCGAPSCGMFYRPRRRQQRWCSEPCGNRARFARHYARQASH